MEYLIIRMICVLLSGMILSQTGSFLQLSSRNILASPSTLGFDGIAILLILVFHSILLFFNLEVPHLVLILSGIPFMLMIGIFYATTLGKKQKLERLILIGLTFNLLVGALFSLWQFLFMAFNLPFPVELWFGHFRFSDLQSLIIIFLFELLTIIGAVYFRKDFLFISFGESLSKNLGVNLKPVQLFMFMMIATGTFAVIALFGAFSFLALIFPILSRKIFFPKWDLNGELFYGALFNGVCLMMIDWFCYQFPLLGAEIPVGLIATSVGAVSLIVLLWKSHMENPYK